MSITAKELAARLNLSATAVSMALNGKPVKQKKPATISAGFP